MTLPSNSIPSTRPVGEATQESVNSTVQSASQGHGMKPKRALRYLLLGCIGLFLFFAYQATASKKKPPPTTIGKSCITSECHTSFRSGWKSQHRPVRFQQCRICHTQVRLGLHKFKPADKSEKKCFTCHRTKPGIHKHAKHIDSWKCVNCHSPHHSSEPKLLLRKAEKLCTSCHRSLTRGRAHSVHSPTQKGKCVHCHRPHTPTRYSKLIRLPRSRMCRTCHSKEIRQFRKAKHPHPSLERNCLNCHNPHKSRNPKLARRRGNALCVNCHKSNKARSRFRSNHYKQTNCLKCHNPHGSDHKKGLVLAANKLCVSCHKEFPKAQKTAKSYHGVDAIGKSCTSCHEHHHSRHPKLLQTKGDALCLNCHNKPLKSRQGKSILNIKAHLAKNPRRHGSTGKQVACRECHVPHTSKHRLLLKLPLVGSFYVPYTQKNYALCFSCHKSELANQKRTRTATRFRNGALNLHYIHVKKDRRGRSCKTCHDTHSSRQPALIRDSVSYGKMGWKLPIRFTQRKDGGTCTSGCHTAKSYRTTTPIRKGYHIYPVKRQPTSSTRTKKPAKPSKPRRR